MPLTLRRKLNQSLVIGSAIVTVEKITPTGVVLSIDAPPEIQIARLEKTTQKKKEEPEQP